MYWSSCCRAVSSHFQACPHTFESYKTWVLDDPLEVSVVKTSLLKHLELDPVVTISVLCDQLLPPIYPPDEPIDVEEQVIRDRLRSLVLSFLTGEAKRSIINIKAESEKVLVGGLLKVSSFHDCYVAIQML